MTALSESNSLNTWPTRFMACIAGASSGLIDTACASPTASSCGTAIFVERGKPKPEQQDGHRKQANCPCDGLPRRGRCVAHADFDQAEGLGVNSRDGPLILDIAVYT